MAPMRRRSSRPSSTRMRPARWKLGQARGIALAPRQAGLEIRRIFPNTVKKTVVGVGHAAKEQIQHMIALHAARASALPDPDAADALAVICPCPSPAGPRPAHQNRSARMLQ